MVAEGEAGKLIVTEPVGVDTLLTETVSSPLLAMYSSDPEPVEPAWTGTIPALSSPRMVSPETLMLLTLPRSRWLSPTPSLLIEAKKCAGAGLGCNP
jgi:hypothetical protein